MLPPRSYEERREGELGAHPGLRGPSLCSGCRSSVDVVVEIVSTTQRSAANTCPTEPLEIACGGGPEGPRVL